MANEANIRAVITAEDRASSVLKGFGDNIVKSAARIAAAYISINSAVDIVQDAIKRVDTLANSQTVFESMGFSAQATKQTMKELDLSIRGLPTSLDNAVKNVELFAGATNDIQKSQKIFTAVNDAVLGFGGTADMVNNAVIQMSQSFSNGRVDAQTWNSMIQSGLGPALNALARQMGITTGALKSGLSDGSISVQQFEDALMNMDKNGSGSMKSFHDLAVASTKGIQTSWANMQTAMVRGVADIINKIGQANIAGAITAIGMGFETALKSVANFTQKLIEVGKQIDTFLAPSLAALMNTINKDLVPALLNFWHKVVEPLIPVIGVLLAGAIWGVVNALNILFQVVAPIFDFLANHTGVLVILAGAFIALKGTIMIWDAVDRLRVAFEILQLQTIPQLTASLGGLNAYLAGFGGFGVLAAVAGGAFAAIAIGAQNMKATVEDTFQSVNRDLNTIDNLEQIMNQKYKSGQITKDQFQKFLLNTRASGGPVGQNQPYLVGEQGPELFVPKQSGTIIPNNKMGGSNATAGGVSITVQAGALMGSDIEARKFAKLIFDHLSDYAGSKNMTVAKMIGV